MTQVHDVIVLVHPDTDLDDAKTLVVTGFGPFLQIKTNPSNIAVTALAESYTPPVGIRVVIAPKVEVAYEPVRDLIPHLWETYEPDFSLNVGVGLRGAFKVERFAKNRGYGSVDVRNVYVNGARPVGQVDAPTATAGEEGAKDAMRKGGPVGRPDPTSDAACACPPDQFPDAEEVYETALDVNQLVEHLAQWWNASKSEDAGRYLCDFTYYQSQYQAAQREGKEGCALFFHVPPVGQPYPQEVLNEAVETVVSYLCEQVLLEGNGWRDADAAEEEEYEKGGEGEEEGEEEEEEEE
ncbi:Pyroglutamyl-peptidase 1 [Allomyces javanicus]|nr:Pyroglutamyl-peptidase 1 [Allomyces javanicus]